MASVFSKTLEEQLFPKNAFYKQAVDTTAFVVKEGNGEKVVKGVAGTNPAASKNRTSLPATISKRTDDSDEYPLDEFTTDPTLIGHTEELIVRYDKRASVLRNHSNVLNTLVASEMAYKWLPSLATNIVRSSGATTRTTNLPSGTGTRKRITKADLIAALEILNRMDAADEGRNILITAEMLSDMLLIDDFVHADKVGKMSALVTGSIGQVLGMNVWVRSSTGVYTNDGTPVKKAVGAAGAARDNAAALVWCASMVEFAEGSTKAFIGEDRPEYYGSIFSFLTRAGGKARKDQKGVVAIVEAAGA